MLRRERLSSHTRLICPASPPPARIPDDDVLHGEERRPRGRPRGRVPRRPLRWGSSPRLHGRRRGGCGTQAGDDAGRGDGMDSAAPRVRPDTTWTRKPWRARAASRGAGGGANNAEKQHRPRQAQGHQRRRRGRHHRKTTSEHWIVGGRSARISGTGLLCVAMGGRYLVCDEALNHNERHGRRRPVSLRCEGDVVAL